MASRASVLRRALPALVLWAIGGCEVLVSGEVSTIHCAADGAIGLPDCPVDFVCKAGTCVNRASINPTLGAQCERDSDCGFGDFCVDPAFYGLPGQKTCSRPCCSSAGCNPEAGFICWAPPSGGVSFCLDAFTAGRDVPGASSPGMPCAAGSQCRSGRCGKTGECLDFCCSDTTCAPAGETCQFGMRDGVTGFFCAPRPASRGAFFDTCKTDTDCSSGLCLDFGTGGTRCSAPCCNSDACGGGLASDQPRPIACGYVDRGSLIRACKTVLPSSQVNAVGQPCMQDNDCRGGVCVPSADGMSPGTCSDACCSDAGCGEGGAFQCRPRSSQGVWALRCEPK